MSGYVPLQTGVGRGKYDRTLAAAARSGGALPQLSTSTLIRPTVEEMEKIDNRISTAFRVMNRAAHGVTTGDIRALIVTGTRGVGKTESMVRKLRESERNGEIEFEIIGGTSSAVSLYTSLYNFRKKNQVLMFDDCDRIFFDMESLNILKRAMDSSDVRTISWNKQNARLDADEVPPVFEYEGGIVIISNHNIKKEIESNSKNAPHFDAIVNRAMWIDTGIHNKWEILVRINQVVFSEEFRTEKRVSLEMVQEMVAWIETNIHRVQSLSIRTVVQLANLMRLYPEHWREDAEFTLLK